MTIIVAFCIGLIAGLRSMTAPAVVSWAAKLKWITLEGSFLSFLSSTVAVLVLSAAAIIEIIADKLPTTPSRTRPAGLIARLVSGALCGAAVCSAANQSIVPGAISGGLGGIAGGLTGYQARTRLVKAANAPDFIIAAIEDVIAIGLGFFLVSRL